ncbi:SIR2 family protein [Nesterenkonia sp. NBAIMH1]|uniref:SIR2 family NAD-dependent protein deacylase n=1 Tax=Nesterenkonia sp. NBAIMH1 TaxID=2600320 RepID=UPI0011B73348
MACEAPKTTKNSGTPRASTKYSGASRRMRGFRMSEYWPVQVVEAARRQELVVVVGAGVSYNSVQGGLRPPTWVDLIRRLADAAKLRGEVSRVLDSLLEAYSLLEAAELVYATAADNSRLADVRRTLRDATDGPEGAHFKPNEWHDALMQLGPTGPRVVVTTNYDRIIERGSDNTFQKHEHDSKTVGQDIRNGLPTLIKVHGSVDTLENTILNQSDYTRLSITGSHVMDVLRALFLTRTVLFLGYSMGDPDIQLVLQNVQPIMGQTPAHYVLCEDVVSYKRSMLQTSFGVTPITYPTNSHDKGLEMLEELAERSRAVGA